MDTRPATEREPRPSVVANEDTGTAKWDSERVMILPPDLLTAIQKQLESTLGAAGGGLLFIAAERQAAETVEVPRGFRPGSAGIPREILEAAGRRQGSLGLGRVRFGEIAGGVVDFTVENNPFALAHGPAAKPVCHLYRGWGAGILHRLTGDEYYCEEAECVATGASTCRFVARPARMR